MTKQPEITDPYTDQPLPDARAAITDAPVETGYDRTSPNPARGGPTAPLYFVAGPDGIVAAFTTPAIEGDDTPDVHRRALNAMYARLTREGKHIPRHKPKKRPAHRSHARGGDTPVTPRDSDDRPIRKNEGAPPRGRE